MIGLELCFPLLLRLGSQGALRSVGSSKRSRCARSRGRAGPPPISRRGPGGAGHDRARAEFVIAIEQLRSKSHNTPFLGREVTGAIVLTMSEGAIIFDTTEDA